jgi:hypothetical protein
MFMASPAKVPGGAIREVSQRNALSSEVGLVTPTFEQIALRAYEIWRREGEVRGKNRDHWLQAVTELTPKTLTDDEDDDEDEQDDAAVFERWRTLAAGYPLGHGTSHS